MPFEAEAVHTIIARRQEAAAAISLRHGGDTRWRLVRRASRSSPRQPVPTEREPYRRLSTRFADLEDQRAGLLARGDEMVTGGLAEMLEILGGAWIGGDDTEHAARRHVAHRLARLQDRQRAFEALGVKNERLAHQPNLLFLGKPWTTRPLEARSPTQPRRSVSVRVRFSPCLQVRPSALVNTLASLSSPSL